MLRATSDDIECGMWNVGCCIDVKNIDTLNQKTILILTRLSYFEKPKLVRWERNHCIEWKKNV
jgi:hypothetical protein